MPLRQISFDTETTGLSSQEDRIIELGAVELIDGIETGVTYHQRIKVDRPINPDAMAVHGIRDSDLVDCPEFADVVGEFLEFIGSDELIIHNGLRFDVPFVNAELARCGLPPLGNKIVDTYVMAQRKLGRGAKLSLDSLADRYGVDRTARTVHGALIDCVILARVYMAMTTTRSDLLTAQASPRAEEVGVVVADTPFMPEAARQRWFPQREGVAISAAELERHNAFLTKMSDPLWKSYLVESGV